MNQDCAIYPHIRISAYRVTLSSVRILIVGQGPVASVLATSLGQSIKVALAVRATGNDSRVLQSRQLRARGQRLLTRQVDLLPVATVTGAWDAVVTTAPPNAPGVRELLTRVKATAVAATTQVPSEVAALSILAGDRPWSIVAPGFLAWDADPVSWWRTGAAFTMTGSAAPLIREAFEDAPRIVPLARVLLQAATMMPVVAGLHAANYNFAEAGNDAMRLARAADEARSAVATDHGAATLRRMSPPAVRAALWGLPRIAPMDLRSSLRTHFGAHTAQTMQMVTDWITSARNHGLATINLEEVREQLSVGQ